MQQQGWYLESKSLYDGKATLLGGNLLEGKMNLKKTVVFLIVCITFFSCDKFLEESPRDKLDVYKRQGKQQIIALDLNKAETILSPYYWLQQNDIIYVLSLIHILIMVHCYNLWLL